MTHYPALINGEEVCTSSVLEVRNPFDDSLVGTTYLAGEYELEQAILAAVSCQNELAVLPSYKKEIALISIAQQLELRSQELAVLLARESGKPLKYARIEISRSVQTFRIAAEECKRFPSEIIQLDWTAAGEGKEGFVKYFPVGLVAGISPFNFPLNLVAHKIAPAIAAACPIVLKPASSAPLSALVLAHIINETDLPKGAVSILPMTRETGNRLVTDTRFKLLSFTGSPDVGWDMKSRAGKKKVVLELGGNAGVILAQSANLSKVILRCAMGAFSYSGQVCIHAQRFFVHSTHFHNFCEMMKTAAEQLVWGEPENESTEFSTMIDAANTKRVGQWVQEAINAGTVLISGGFERDGIYAPTILTNVKKSMRVFSEEVFGPVITIEPFDQFEQAVALLNDSRFGLQAGVYTDSISEMDFAFQHIECGGVIINDVPTFRADHMPYGGVKDSGLGREGVKYAMLDMLEPRVLVK